MFTDGAATSATGSSPVFSSASYNFVAGDVGAWVFIASGTNWTPGWYKIASVASNQATLSAASGAGVLYKSSSPVVSQAPTTTAGCATTASPTAATWSIDYSQQTTAQFTYTDMASTGAGLTVSSAGHPFGKQQVGNCIVVTSGTNFNTGRYVIASVAAGVATVVGPTNITSGVGSGGNGGQGGALATPAKPPVVNGNKVNIAAGTYTITSGSSNVAGGVISNSSVWYEGYNSVRGDLGTAPILQISGGGGVTNVTIMTNPTYARNIVLDGNSQTGIQGFSTNQAGIYHKITAKNCKNGGFNGSGFYFFCTTTGCSGSNGSTNATMSLSGYAYGCEAYSNTQTGMATTGNGTVFDRCISYSNSGSSSDGIHLGNFNTIAINCVAYGNGRHGFNYDASNTGVGYYINCIAEGQTAVGAHGFKGAGSSTFFVFNCAAYNNSTNIDSSIGSIPAPDAAKNVTILTGSPFTNAAGGDFSLNSTSGAGASCKAAGAPSTFPDGTTAASIDIGASQTSTGGGGAGAMILARVFTGY